MLTPTLADQDIHSWAGNHRRSKRERERGGVKLGGETKNMMKEGE